MKVYKLEVLVLDFESYGEDSIRTMLENTRGLSVSVLSARQADIGKWDDENPLNSSYTQHAEVARLFPAQEPKQ